MKTKKINPYRLAEEHMFLDQKIAPHRRDAEELKRFILQEDEDRLVELKEQCQQGNVDKLFKACAELGIERIFVGEEELVTAPEDDCRADDWPATWKLSSMLNDEYGDRNQYRMGCGNGHQSQVRATVKGMGYFPVGFTNKAYDVKSREPISYVPFVAGMVCTRHFKE